MTPTLCMSHVLRHIYLYKTRLLKWCCNFSFEKKSNIYRSFSVKLPNKSWIMALTQIIDSMLLFSEKKKTMLPQPSSPCYIWTIPFRAALDTQPASQPGVTSSFQCVSCHLPIRAGAITQMDLANTASSRQSWTLSNFFFFDFWLSNLYK